jgi:hypothetical protein
MTLYADPGIHARRFVRYLDIGSTLSISIHIEGLGCTSSSRTLIRNKPLLR